VSLVVEVVLGTKELVELIVSLDDEVGVVVTVVEVGDDDGSEVVVVEYTVEDELEASLQGSKDSRS
jgi:hypothetical protein